MTSADKQALQDRLRSLNDELDSHLAAEYGVETNKTAGYAAWRTSHQPFHWFVEFYGIMGRGGFDVVIGNPPYVKCKSLGYSVKDFGSFKFPDIYGYIVIQSYRIKKSSGRCGFIVPLSLSFSFQFSDLRKEIGREGIHWLSSFDNGPAALFAGVGQRCTILISASQDRGLFTTRLFRWRAPFRHSLLTSVAYSSVPKGLNLEEFGVPRIPDDQTKKLLNLHKGFATTSPKGLRSIDRTVARLGFSSTARNFISTYLEKPPTVTSDGEVMVNGNLGTSLALPSREYALAALAATSGNMCFWYWLTRGDGFHVTNGLLSEFLSPIANFPVDCREELRSVGDLLHEYRYLALVFKKNAGKYVGNFNYQAVSSLTLRADLVFLVGLGANWQDAERLHSLVSLVRSVNEAAGEKNIPRAIKNQFPRPETNGLLRDERLIKTDEWLSARYSVKSTQIVGLVNA